MFGILELACLSTLQAFVPAWTPAMTETAAQSAQSASATVQADEQDGGGTKESQARPVSQISGYGELHLNRPTDGTAGTLDLHRFVLLFTHRFSDRLRFVSEVEIEHAFVEGLEEGGELELEQ